MSKFEQITPQAQLPAAPSYAEKSFLHTLGAAVVVPFWQSVAISMAVGLVALILFVRFGALITDALLNAGTVAAITFLISLLFLLRHWFFLTVERTLNIDLPGVGEEKPKEPKVTRIQIDELTKAGHIRQAKMINLPASEDELKTLFTGLQAGRPFSEREWAGDGKLLSVSRFRDLRAEMIRRELLTLRNSKDARQGYILTPEGKAVQDTYADLLSPSQPLDGAK